MRSGWPRSSTMVRPAVLRPLPRVSRLGSAGPARSKAPAQKGAHFFMLETNLRVVGRGPALRLTVRTAQVDGTDTSPELLQKLCGRLRQRYGVAAVPDPRAAARLIVATKRPLEPLLLDDDDWELEVTDAGAPQELLTPTDELGRAVLSPLVE